MKHSLAMYLFCGVVTSAISSTAMAQDRIRFIDRATKKESSATGAILEETPSRVIYKLGATGAVKEIAGPDVLDVTYEVPGAIKLDYSRAASEERKAFDPSVKEADRKKGLADALRDYDELAAKMAGERYKQIRRHLQFKIGRLLAKQSEEDPSQADSAIAALIQFMKENPDSWQIVQCARLLAKLQLSKGDTAGAYKTYEQLAATPDVPGEVKQDCALRATEMLILGKKFAEAENLLQRLSKASSDEAQANRVRIYMAECQGASGKLTEAMAQLDNVISTTADKDLKALAYNAKGDCYRLNGKHREALWPYLWVDVIYHQDREQHLKAMEQLVKLFEEQGDKTRAKQYRERLQREER
jgi:predicted negative regulator of RcsB-dependent stress response